MAANNCSSSYQNIRISIGFQRRLTEVGRSRYSLLIVLIGYLLYFLAPLYYEREQCTRKCRWENSKYDQDSQRDLQNIHGQIDFWNPTLCKCVDITNKHSNISVVKTERLNEWSDWKWNYDNNKVCKSNDTNEILHCGQCGKCSNTNDIAIYDKLKFYLVRVSRNCALLSLIPPTSVGKYLSTQCFDYFTGFTTGCVDCWVDNFLCAATHCKSVCFKELVFGVDWNQGDDGDQGKLSPCLACDEFNCGPQFIDCAGVNRRAAGLPSDINRNDEQVCTKTKLYEKYK